MVGIARQYTTAPVASFAQYPVVIMATKCQLSLAAVHHRASFKRGLLSWLLHEWQRVLLYQLENLVEMSATFSASVF